MMRELPHGHNWVTVDFSPDSKMIAVGGAISDLLSIYDLSKDNSDALIKSVEARVY